MQKSNLGEKKEKLFYNRLDRAIIPVGKQLETKEEIYEGEEWSRFKIKLTGTELIYQGRQKSGSINIKNIYYMDRKLVHPKAVSPKVLSFNYQTEEGNFIALIKNRTTRAKEVLKKRLLRQIVRDANIWYISSYRAKEKSRKPKKWKEGIFKIGADNTLRIENTEGKVVTTIPPEDVIRLNPISKQKRVNLKIYHSSDGELKVDLIYSTEVPLDIVTDFFYIDYLDGLDNKLEEEELTLDEIKVLMALEEIEDEKEEEKTIPKDELISHLQWEEEKTLETLSSLESKGLIIPIENKILRTFAGVISTPEELDIEKHKKQKELEQRREERKERLQKLLKLKDEV